jgi:hypothetical protein
MESGNTHAEIVDRNGNKLNHIAARIALNRKKIKSGAICLSVITQLVLSQKA